MRTNRIFISFIMSLSLMPMGPLRTSAECRDVTSIASEPAVIPGRPAPSFSLKDLDGRTVDLRDLRGKVVLIDFWAGWCGPCRRELPTIEKLHRDLKDLGLVVLGINVESESDARKVFAESGRDPVSNSIGR